MILAGKLSRGRAMPKTYYNGKNEVYLFGIVSGSIEIYSLKYNNMIKRQSIGMEGILQNF